MVSSKYVNFSWLRRITEKYCKTVDLDLRPTDGFLMQAVPLDPSERSTAWKTHEWNRMVVYHLSDDLLLFLEGFSKFYVWYWAPPPEGDDQQGRRERKWKKVSLAHPAPTERFENLSRLDNLS